MADMSAIHTTSCLVSFTLSTMSLDGQLTAKIEQRQRLGEASRCFASIEPREPPL